MAINIIVKELKHLSSLRCRTCDLQWRARSPDWTKILYHIFGRTVFTCKLGGQCLNSFWNNQKFIIFMIWRSVWPWMKVKVNTINMWCILMSEACANFDDDDVNSFRGILCEAHTHTRAETQGRSWTLTFSRSLTSFKAKLYSLQHCLFAWPFLKARTTLQHVRTLGNNLRTQQNADKPNTDSDRLRFFVFCFL